MFSKTFKEMMEVDIERYLKERDKAKYLPWGACKKLLHENGAEKVMFWPVPGPDGSTLRKSDIEFTDKNGTSNRCYEVVVHIVVDALEWETTYPVLNGTNPVKDNSMNQLRVHNAIRRAFVKGVAERTGLGFDLWLDDEDMPEAEDLSKHSLKKCRERMQELITSKINSGIPTTVIYDRLGMEEETFRAKLSYYKELEKLEKDLAAIQP